MCLSAVALLDGKSLFSAPPQAARVVLHGCEDRPCFELLAPNGLLGLLPISAGPRSSCSLSAAQAERRAVARLSLGLWCLVLGSFVRSICVHFVHAAPAPSSWNPAPRLAPPFTFAAAAERLLVPSFSPAW